MYYANRANIDNKTIIDTIYETIVKHAVGIKVDNDPNNLANYFCSQFDIWKKCFSSPLVNVSNYDDLETVGDGVLKMCVLNLAYSTYTDLTPNELSNMVKIYGSNEYIASIVRNEGYYNLLDTPVEIQLTDNMKKTIHADLFEAILGTLFVIGNQCEILPCIGFVAAYRWYKYMLDMSSITLQRNITDNVTTLAQIFNRFHGGDLQPKLRKHDLRVGDRIFKVGAYVLTQSQVIQFNNICKKADQEIRLPSTVVNGIILTQNGEEIRAETDKLLRNEAAAAALQYLSQFGITQAWATDIKNIIDVGEDDFETLRRLLPPGYTNFSVVPYNKLSNENSNVLQLRAYTREGTLKILTSMVVGGDVAEGKREIVREYIKLLERHA